MHCDDSSYCCVVQPSSPFLLLCWSLLCDDEENYNKELSVTNYDASLQPNSSITSSKRQKKSVRDKNLNTLSHTQAKDQNGRWIDCKHCETLAGVHTRLDVRHPFNNGHWNRYVVTQSNSCMVVKTIWDSPNPCVFQSNM